MPSHFVFTGAADVQEAAVPHDAALRSHQRTSVQTIKFSVCAGAACTPVRGNAPSLNGKTVGGPPPAGGAMPLPPVPGWVSDEGQPGLRVTRF